MSATKRKRPLQVVPLFFLFFFKTSERLNFLAIENLGRIENHFAPATFLFLVNYHHR